MRRKFLCPSYRRPMPAANPRPCTAWPCPKFRPCPIHDKRDHDPELERERNARRTKSTSVYWTPRWDRLRRRILLERPWCQWPRCHLPATDVDHRIPIEDGGAPWDEDNLQALCHAHHSRKTADDVARRRAAGPRG